LFDFIVSVLNISFFFFGMPLKSIAFMLMMQLVNAFVILDIFRNILSVSVAYLLYFSQMFHVHLVSHLLIYNASACRVDH